LEILLIFSANIVAAAQETVLLHMYLRNPSKIKHPFHQILDIQRVERGIGVVAQTEEHSRSPSEKLYDGRNSIIARGPNIKQLGMLEPSK
jgi:hypothetical protein